MSDEQNAFLKKWELDAVYFIEQHHSSTGEVPKDDDIIEYLKLLKHNINSAHIASLKTNSLFKASMQVRGIPVNYEDDGELRDIGPLSGRQLAAAAVMMNLTDRRSDEKKLRDIGVSTEEYTTWMQDAKFASYMAQRAEVLVANSVHEAHMGLMRGVRQGNTASIKLYYELTGRYNPNEENQVNVRMLIGRVLEAIQRHVRNPDTLNSLAVELSQLAIEAGSPVANQTTIPGKSTRKEIM